MMSETKSIASGQIRQVWQNHSVKSEISGVDVGEMPS